MSDQHGTPKPKRGVNVGAALLAAVYLIAIFAVGIWARPVSRGTLTGIALFPGVIAFLAGIPRVIRPGAHGIMALFHLVLYPLLAVIFLGLPGTWIASQLAELKF